MRLWMLFLHLSKKSMQNPIVQAFAVNLALNLAIYHILVAGKKINYCQFL